MNLTQKLISIFTAISVISSCSVDETVIHPVPDNAEPRKMPLSLFAGVTEEIAAELGVTDGIPSSVCAFLVETNGKNILFDSGNGGPDSQLLPVLRSLGTEASEVDHIFITHLHGDHIGGLLSPKDDKAAFPSASLYINKVEYDAWMAMPEDKTGKLKDILQAYEGRTITFDVSEKLPYGIEAIEAYGHTPGHTMYLIGDNIIAGDIMHGVALQTAHPEICARFDMDTTRAAASRKSLLETARKGHLKIYGMHFPAPYHL